MTYKNTLKNLFATPIDKILIGLGAIFLIGCALGLVWALAIATRLFVFFRIVICLIVISFFIGHIIVEINERSKK